MHKNSDISRYLRTHRNKLLIIKVVNIENLDIELIDLRSSDTWENKFVNLRATLEDIKRDNFNLNTDADILKTWDCLPWQFDTLKTISLALLTIFPSTYCCESLFSEMNYILNKNRNRLTTESLAACVALKLTMCQTSKNLLTTRNVMFKIVLIN